MAFASAKWRSIAQSERLCRSSQAVSVVGQKAYIFGGELHPRSPVDNRIDIVSLEDDGGAVETTSAPTDAPTPRVGSPSTTIGERVYLFSGRGGLDMKPIEEEGAIWCHETRTAVWSLIRPADSTASYPVGRSYHCIASGENDSIYIHSGCPESGRLSDLWVFNISTKSWSELSSGPAPARGGASIAYASGKIYRMNGFDGTTEQGGALDVYGVATGSWTTISFGPDGVQGPEARSVATLLALTIYGKQWLVTMFGERDPSSLGHAGAGKMLSDVWAWDIGQSSWTQIAVAGNCPEPRGWFDAGVSNEGSGEQAIIVHGGLSEENTRLGDVWKLCFV